MKTHTTKLIEGDFSPDSAHSLLSELLHHKINFHKLQKLSNEIRFGEDREHSEKRIKELSAEKQKLTQWFNSLESTDQIKINCNINIEKISNGV